MINETVSTITPEKVLSFSNWTSVTLSNPFIISMIVVWLFPILVYIIVGCIAKGRSASGQVFSKRMIAYPNFWYAPIIWFFIQGALILCIILFPLWLRYMEGSG